MAVKTICVGVEEVEIEAHGDSRYEYDHGRWYGLQGLEAGLKQWPEKHDQKADPSNERYFWIKLADVMGDLQDHLQWLTLALCYEDDGDVLNNNDDPNGG